MLINLPAYKIKDERKNIIEEYGYGQVHKLVDKKVLEEKNIEFGNYNNIELSNSNYIEKKSTEQLYEKLNQIDILRVSWEFLPKKYKVLSAFVLLLFTISLAIRIDSTIFKIIGSTCFFVFCNLFFICGIKISDYYVYTSSTLRSINIAYKKAKEVICLLEKINNSDLESEAKSITKKIVETDISNLAYELANVNIYSVILSLLFSCFFVYICGDTFIENIKLLINIERIDIFDLLKNLNTKVFVFAVVFPVSKLVLDHSIILGLKRRNRSLQDSLYLINRS